MGLFKSFLFDGVKSEDFGAHITGSAVYDAPQKDVELVEIPGRNGALIIDNNRFKNIQVSYPASIAGKDQADFSEKVRALRGFLTSRVGYKRLEDEYNLDEFRMGVYKDGLQVDPIAHGKAGRFDIVFDCMPQRFLKSGEAPFDFSASGKIYNPTFFESSPLLEVQGRGEIVLNGYPININVDALGELPLFNAVTGSGSQVHANFGDVPYASGDGITVKNSAWTLTFKAPSGGYILDSSLSNISGVQAVNSVNQGGNNAMITVSIPSAAFVEGTASTVTGSVKLYLDGKLANTNNFTDTITITVTLAYNGSKKITAFVSISGTSNTSLLSSSIKLGDGFVNSSITSLNKTLYIDCEIGEAYTEDLENFNNAVSLGAELPKLSPGENTINLANTIISLRIIPRWWKI